VGTTQVLQAAPMTAATRSSGIVLQNF